MTDKITDEQRAYLRSIFGSTNKITLDDNTDIKDQLAQLFAINPND